MVFCLLVCFLVWLGFIWMFRSLCLWFSSSFFWYLCLLRRYMKFICDWVEMYCWNLCYLFKCRFNECLRCLFDFIIELRLLIVLLYFFWIFLVCLIIFCLFNWCLLVILLYWVCRVKYCVLMDFFVLLFSKCMCFGYIWMVFVFFFVILFFFF